MQGVVTVPKENIGQAQFYKEEVLKNEDSRKIRQYFLLRAQTLGNLYHQKVNIVYLLRNGEIQQVETTIWAVEGDYIVLKGGVTIPVHAILEVEF
jgi:hypothetical protein